jgi:cytochrome c553
MISKLKIFLVPLLVPFHFLFVLALVTLGISFSSVSAYAQDAAAGQTLYTQNCTICHGAPTNASPRKGTKAAVITNAISSVNQMQSLKGLLSATDIANIAAYIATANTTTPTPVGPAFNVTAMWWAEQAESGWGMSAIQSATNKVFVVVYTYAADGRSTWFVLPDSTWTTPTSLTGKLYQTTGPAFNAVPFDGTRVGVTAVGTLTMNFSDANNATLNYTVNGAVVSKIVTRQVY